MMGVTKKKVDFPLSLFRPLHHPKRLAFERVACLDATETVCGVEAESDFDEIPALNEIDVSGLVIFLDDLPYGPDGLHDARAGKVNVRVLEAKLRLSLIARPQTAPLKMAGLQIHFVGVEDTITLAR